MRPGEVADELDRFAAKLPGRVKAIAQAQTDLMMQRIKTERFRPWVPVPTPFGTVYDRSGDLKAALRGLVSSLDDEIKARLFVDPTQPHERMKASVSEFGKRGIHATFASVMTIPIGAALKGNGDRRYPGGAGDVQDYDVFRRADRLLGRAKGLKGASIVSLFKLKGTVDVPAKQWARPEVEEALVRIQSQVEEMFDRFTAQGEA